MDPITPAEAGFYIKSFKERLDKHGKEAADGFARVEDGFARVFENLKDIQTGQEKLRLDAKDERLETFKEIQKVKDSVNILEKAMSEKNYKLSLKVVSLSAAIGMIGGGAGSEIKTRFLDKPVPQVQQERTVIEYKSTSPIPQSQQNNEVQQ